MDVCPFPGLADKYHEIHFNFARERLLPAAENGDRSETLRMLHFISGAMADHCRIPPDVADWLAPALFRVSCGETVEAAFGIPNRKRGEGKEGGVRVNRGRRYMMAYKSEHLHVDDKQKREVAWQMVAEAYGVSIETVRAAYRDHKQQVQDDCAVEREVRELVRRDMERKAVR